MQSAYLVIPSQDQHQAILLQVLCSLEREDLRKQTRNDEDAWQGCKAKQRIASRLNAEIAWDISQAANIIWMELGSRRKGAAPATSSAQYRQLLSAASCM